MLYDVYYINLCDNLRAIFVVINSEMATYATKKSHAKTPLLIFFPS